MENEDVVTTISKGKYFAQICYDTDPSNPREDDNLGTMVCWHRNYNLGDFENHGRLHGKGENTFTTVEDFQEWYNENHNDIAVILPLFLYDHSGITMSTGSFHDIFDSGQVGFIFVTKEQVKKEYSCKIVSAKLKERVTEYLKNEVSTYDDYLTGSVYGYKLFKLDIAEDEELEDSDDPEDYGEEIDSCWGYYGLEYLKEEINNTIDYYMKEDQEESWANLSKNESAMQES